MDRFARALVRWRWVVLVVWAVIGAVAAVRAPATPALLNIRGGSARPTEASRTENLLTARFSRPIGEFFAVTLEGPGPRSTGPGPRAVLDSLLAGLSRQPYVRGLVSYPTTDDSTFLSRDRRSTFVIVALKLTTGDSAGALVPAGRAELVQADPRPHARRPALPGALVTGRAPLDLDVRSVVDRATAPRGEKRAPAAHPDHPGARLRRAGGGGASAGRRGARDRRSRSPSSALIAHVTPMSVFVLNMTTMIGLGVGIDYSLLVVTRFREELARGAAAPRSRRSTRWRPRAGGDHLGAHRRGRIRRAAAHAR